MRLQPNDPAAWNNFGNALSALRRFKDAAHAFKRTLALRPRHAGAHNNLGMALNALGDTLGAISHFRAALEAEPNYVAAHFNLGNLLDTNGHPEDALPVLRKAVALQPHFAPGYFGLAHALAKLGRHDEAVPHFERAVGLDPKYGVAWLCLGNAHLALGAHRAALRAFDEALRIDPSMPAAHLNRALALLTTGDYARGLPAYEWRLQTPGSEPAPRLPRWNGEPMPGRTLLVRAEQGFGDTLQFARFVPFAAKLVGKLVLEVQPALVPLLAPAAQAARIELKSKSDGVPTHADAYLPAAQPAARARHDLARSDSGARALSRRARRLPAQVARLDRRAGTAQDRHRVVRADAARRDALGACRASLRRCFALEDVDWIVLQPFITGRERDMLRAHPNARSIHTLEGRLENFADTGAIVDRLDAVVSVDTSVAHLAGALGKPLWVMLPFAADWRWGVDTAESTWYPQARLVRQRAPGRWRDVIEATAAALALLPA